MGGSRRPHARRPTDAVRRAARAPRPRRPSPRAQDAASKEGGRRAGGRRRGASAPPGDKENSDFRIHKGKFTFTNLSISQLSDFQR